MVWPSAEGPCDKVDDKNAEVVARIAEPRSRNIASGTRILSYLIRVTWMWWSGLFLSQISNHECNSGGPANPGHRYLEN